MYIVFCFLFIVDHMMSKPVIFHSCRNNLNKTILLGHSLAPVSLTGNSHHLLVISVSLTKGSLILRELAYATGKIHLFEILKPKIILNLCIHCQRSAAASSNIMKLQTRSRSIYSRLPRVPRFFRDSAPLSKCN